MGYTPEKGMTSEMGKRFLAAMVSLLVCVGCMMPVSAEEEGTAEKKTELAVNAKAAILIEQETGTVLFEKNADEKLEPASVTKVMTMALVLEQVSKGKIKLDDMVTATARAKEMGGTQINLDDGEQMSVYDLLMAVAVASANDAAVALGEYVGGGSEAAFVEMMNQKAKELHMENTHFENTNGLPAEGHLTTARDIALMSRFLLSFEQASEFTSTDRYPIRSDTNEYMMRNSNALVREYDGCIGLKTGYTQTAGHCLSSAATRNGMTVIAVVLGESDSKTRFQESKELLDYAFAHYDLYRPEVTFEQPGEIPVKMGTQGAVAVVPPAEQVAPVVIKKGAEPNLEIKTELEESVTAPVEEGAVVGKTVVTLDGKEVGAYEYKAAESVTKRTVWSAIQMIFYRIFTM